jgi:hypothetical protein
MTGSPSAARKNLTRNSPLSGRIISPKRISPQVCSARTIPSTLFSPTHEGLERIAQLAQTTRKDVRLSIDFHVNAV